MGYEKVTLYGLDVVARRRIPYAKVDPEECRNLFIRRALVEGDYQSRAPFIARNREMLDTVENLEKKTRRRDLLVDDERSEEHTSELQSRPHLVCRLLLEKKKKKKKKKII